MLLHQRLDARAAVGPTRPAIIFEDRTISYAELVAGGRAAAAMLADNGLGRGDVVAWLGSNQPFIIELFYACSLTGSVLLPLNTRQKPAEHRLLLDHAQAALLAVEPAMAASAQDALPGATALWVGDGHDLTGEWAGAEPSDVDAELLLVYTSGTTGSPKGVVHTQRSVATTLANGIESQHITAADVMMSFLPLFHVGGLNIQTLPTLAQGGTVVLHRRFDPAQVVADIERFGGTIAVCVPATIQPLLDHPSWATADLGSMRGISAGSSIIPPWMLHALNDRGIPAGQVYGSTETGPTCVVLGADEADRVGSAGRAAPHSEIRIIEGELQVRGDHLFTHYRNNPEATAAAFDDGWFRTGDVARLDDDGLVWIEGRVDDLIISGGENVDPVEVEEALGDAPGVREVAVVAGDDERWGQVPVAFVVAAGGEPNLADLRSHGEATLARYKLPAKLVVVEELPRTALGKVRKFELRTQLAELPNEGS